MTRPCFDSVMSLIKANIVEDSTTRSANMSGGLREFKLIFLLISIYESNYYNAKQLLLLYKIKFNK